MKKTIASCVAIIFALLALTGCNHQDNGSSTQTTVSNIFTQPVGETAPDPSMEMATAISSWVLPEYSLDDVGHFVSYEGGEMHLPYSFTYTGSELSEYGVTIMLFLDGRLQPFRINDSDTVQYVHTLYPEASEDSKTVTLDLVFTPITGHSGDTLDLSIYSRQFSDWKWENEAVGLEEYTSSITTRLKFSQTPPEATLPDAESRVLSWNCDYTDCTLSEYESWSEDSWNKLSNCLRITNEEYTTDTSLSGQWYRYLFDVTPEVSMELSMELVNTSGVEYGIVVFVDNQPVSTDPADLIYIDEAPGQKTTLTLTLDMSNFEDQSKVYAVVIPRNYLSTIGYTADVVVDLVDTMQSYLFSAPTWTEALK